MQQEYERQIDKILKTVHALPEQTQKATILALNRTAEWLKGQVSKELSKEKRIKLKIIRDKIKLLKANRRNLKANLNCNFKIIPIKEIGKVTQNSVGTSVGNLMFPHAFIATIRKDWLPNVYRRTTKKRFPIRVVGIPIYDSAKQILRTWLGKETQQVFEKRFLHEITRISGALE